MVARGTVRLFSLGILLAFTLAAPTRAADYIKVGVLKPGMYSSIFWIAVRTGSFERNGIAVEEHALEPGAAEEAVKQVARHDTYFYIGFNSGDAIQINAQAVRAGKRPPLAIVQAGDPGDSWIVLRSDLAGKTLEQLKEMPLRVGVSDASSNYLPLFGVYLSSKGITADQFKWDFLPSENMASTLARKELDGFIGDALTTTYAMNDQTGEVFMHARKGDMGPRVAVYPSVVVIANRGFLKERPDVARRFMKALAEASALYASESRNEMISYVGEWIRKTRKVTTPLLDRFDPRLSLARTDAQTWWELDSAQMKKQNELPETMSFDDVFDLSYLP